jgi:hypothetical protein
VHFAEITPGHNDRSGNGPAWKSMQIEASRDGLPEGIGFGCNARLYELEKRQELSSSARKFPITDPEIMYIAFPFAMDHDRVLYECQGGLVAPGSGMTDAAGSDFRKAFIKSAVTSVSDDLIKYARAETVQQGSPVGKQVADYYYLNFRS